MRRIHKVSAPLAWLAVAGMCLPWQAAMAQQPVAAQPALRGEQPAPIMDVALGQGGLLAGQIYSTSGSPEAGVEVALLDGDQCLAMGQADAQGRFAFQGLRGGSYQVATPGAAQVVRAWAPATAPPAAQSAVMLVSDDQTVRGQACECGGTVGCADCVGPGTAYGGRPVMRWMRRNPGLVVAGVAAAIAVPIAIAAADDDDPAS